MITLPSVSEAIIGKFKVYPLWKKQGNTQIELTEYPVDKLEPIGQGREDKH